MINFGANAKSLKTEEDAYKCVRCGPEKQTPAALQRDVHFPMSKSATRIHLNKKFSIPPLVLMSLLGAIGCGASGGHPTQRSAPVPATGTADSDSPDTEVAVPTPPTPASAPVTTPVTDPAPTPLTARAACPAPAGAALVAGPIASIRDLVTLLNAMPKPVTLPCLLDVLPRPLDVAASTSILSVQPAQGSESPRIFVFLGPLILAIVPDGHGSQLLELGEMLSDTRSVKAEIALPVTLALAPAAPFERVVPSGGHYTTCAGCHGSESAVPNATAFDGTAYQSRALKPLPTTLMPFAELRARAEACAVSVSPRCEVLRALFGSDPAQTRAKEFPAGMATFF